MRQSLRGLSTPRTALVTNMTLYYAEKLSGQRLRRCYDIASPRVQRYLEAEIQHVLGRLRRADAVLELGCGYGRVALRLNSVARLVVGIDIAEASVAMARKSAGRDTTFEFLCMDALHLGFRAGQFDAVICVQNGVCAFGVDPEALALESLRVLRPGGRLLFSTYSDRLWHDRLAWFEAQAMEGLLGPVDHEASRDGVIVCTDGFRSGRLTPGELQSLCSRLGVESEISEVDESSVFCEVTRTERKDS
jgi:SAM-dependent methyltransferase